MKLKLLNKNGICEWNFWHWQNKTKLESKCENKLGIIESKTDYWINVGQYNQYNRF